MAPRDQVDGYRAIAFRSGGRVHLRSRNDKDFSQRYSAVAGAPESLPDETVIDGEIVARDESGRPSFNALQNFGPTTAPIFYYVFDLMILNGRNVIAETVDARRDLLESEVLPHLNEPIRSSPLLPGSALIWGARSNCRGSKV